VEMLEEHRNAFYKICQLNKDGAFMDILRTFLIQLITEKLKAAEATGSCSNISYPIYTYLLADFYISAAKCYLESDGAYTKEDFIDNICRFVNRDFFG
jgi:hypothetical protein